MGQRIAFLMLFDRGWVKVWYEDPEVQWSIKHFFV